MQDKDQKLIWENYNKSIPVSKPKFTSKERDRLMGVDKNTPKPVSIKVNKEESDDTSTDDFKMTEDDWSKAEQESGGLRLSKFVQQHDVNAEQPVAVHATYVQKHYGKIHAAQKGAVTGSSIADAIRGFGGGPLKNALDGVVRFFIWDKLPVISGIVEITEFIINELFTELTIICDVSFLTHNQI